MCTGTTWSTERVDSRREIAHLRRVPALLVVQIRRVFSLLAPWVARNCAISLGPSTRSVLSRPSCADRCWGIGFGLRDDLTCLGPEVRVAPSWRRQEWLGRC